jgi:2-dehydropantoate 2-reductase
VRIAVVGAGAVGGLAGGHLARAGHDVTLIDGWPEHVAAIRSSGLVLARPGAEDRVPVAALHVGEVQSLHARPVDLAFVCVKLYDTDWATALVAPYLAPSGFVVTMQNGLIEERVAAIVGWGRTVGCIAGGLYVGLDGPGRVLRGREAARGPRTVFHVGEVHGRVTPRARAVADLLARVDGAEVTTNLWGERWSKLVANSVTSALCAASGRPMRSLLLDPDAQRVMARLGGEAAAVGLALGFAVEPVFGLPVATWVGAGNGEDAPLEAVRAALAGVAADMHEAARSGMAQDIAKGRRTEIDYMNGYVAAKAACAGLAAPTHAALASRIRRIEAGAARPGPDLVEGL